MHLMVDDSPLPTGTIHGGATARFLRYAATGDPGVLEALLGEHSLRAYNQARRLLGHPADADDAVQEAFLQLVRTVRRFDGSVAFAPWLGRLVHTACLRALRSRARLRRERAPMTDHERSDNDGDEQAETIRRAVAHLPERYRVPVALHYFGQLDLTQTAASLGLSVATVTVRLHRARERLRRNLSPQRGSLTGNVIAATLASAPVRQPSAAMSASTTQLVAAVASGTALPSTTISISLIQQGALFMACHPVIACAISAVLVLGGTLVPLVIAADAAPPQQHRDPQATAAKIMRYDDFHKWQEDDGSWNDRASLKRFPGWESAGVLPSADNTGMCTGLATLVLLGAGYDHHSSNKHRERIANALGWIIATQKPDGSLGEDLATHAVLTMVLAEYSEMTRDGALDRPLARAVQALLARRVEPQARPGWKVWVEPDGLISTRTNALCVMALKTASFGGNIEAGRALAQAAQWLEAVWRVANPTPLDPERAAARFPAVIDPDPTAPVTHEDDPASALVIDVLTNRSTDRPLRRTLANAVERLPMPTLQSADTGELWLRTQACFHGLRGDRWKAWSTIARRHVEACATPDGPFAGTWSAAPSGRLPAGGRISASACAELTQQIFRRYDPVESAQGDAGTSSPTP